MEKRKLEEALREQSEQYNLAKARYDELNAAKKQSKDESLRLLDRAKQHRPTEEEKEKFAEFPDSSIELDKLLQAEKARLELTIDSDPEIIQTYNDRRRRIERLQQQLADCQEQVQEIENQMNAVKNAWEPKITELVEGISERFGEYFSSTIKSILKFEQCCRVGMRWRSANQARRGL